MRASSNSATAIRLVEATMIDMHDDWTADARRYLLEDSMANRYKVRGDRANAATGCGE